MIQNDFAALQVMCCTAFIVCGPFSWGWYDLLILFKFVSFIYTNCFLLSCCNLNTFSRILVIYKYILDYKYFSWIYLSFALFYKIWSLKTSVLFWVSEI